MNDNRNQIRPYSGADMRLPAPAQHYLTVTERGATRYVPDPQPRRPPALVGDVLPPEAPRSPVQTVQTVATSHVDRSLGFNLVTVPLAAVTGLVALLVAVALADVPLLSWSALLILFGAFVAVWGAAYAWHTLASPDGATILAILLAYRFQRHEQRARLDRLAAWEEYEDDKL